MASDSIAISIRNLTKTYRLFGHPGDRIKQFFCLGLKQYHREFTALNSVSFDIKKGETVGIIGRNGSGKSTLLQLICGILKPTSGSVKVSGRISALLELGAGFNPDFTGRENVYFQGALMGFAKEQMDERFDEIVDFADIGAFIDQPVRVYSSGMFVRLAFAVAIHVEPDILIVDEALGVGDQAFQAKCLKYIDLLRSRGGTIVFVSHSLEQIAHHCHSVSLLEHGKLVAHGNTASTLEVYLRSLAKPPGDAAFQAGTPILHVEDRSADDFQTHPSYSLHETRWGDGKASILFAEIRQGGEINPECLLIGHEMEVAIEVLFKATVSQPVFGLTLKTDCGAILFSTNSYELSGPSAVFSVGARAKVTFGLTPWIEVGSYFLSLGVVSETPQGLVPHDRRYDALLLTFIMPCSESGEPEMEPTFALEVLR